MCLTANFAVLVVVREAAFPSGRVHRFSVVNIVVCLNSVVVTAVIVEGLTALVAVEYVADANAVATTNADLFGCAPAWHV